MNNTLVSILMDPKLPYAEPYQTRFSSHFLHFYPKTITFAWQSTTLVTLLANLRSILGVQKSSKSTTQITFTLLNNIQYTNFQCTLSSLFASLFITSSGFRHPLVFRWSPTRLHHFNSSQQVFKIHGSSSLHFLATGLQHSTWISSPTGLPLVTHWSSAGHPLVFITSIPLNRSSTSTGLHHFTSWQLVFNTSPGFLHPLVFHRSSTGLFVICMVTSIPDACNVSN